MPTHDAAQAANLATYRKTLEAAGGSSVPARPWQHSKQPLSDGELVRLAAWKADDHQVAPEVVIAGLGLLESARAELDQVEAGLLFAARASGLTFQQIASALGLGSGQAAQQRMSRVLARLDSSS